MIIHLPSVLHMNHYNGQSASNINSSNYIYLSSIQSTKFIIAHFHVNFHKLFNSIDAVEEIFLNTYSLIFNEILRVKQLYVSLTF
jgi:hypothetical protein